MATKIFDIETNEVHELSLITDGQDFLFEVISNIDPDGHWYTERDDAEFEMGSADLAWWTRWAEREQRINAVAQERGEDTIKAICGLADEYGHDLEVLQDRCEEYLGLK